VSEQKKLALALLVGIHEMLLASGGSFSIIELREAYKRAYDFILEIE
jgi:hypothetical protein